MRRSMQDLQSSLRSHSRKALKAAVGLETCNANLSYTHKYTPFRLYHLLSSPGKDERPILVCL